MRTHRGRHATPLRNDRRFALMLFTAAERLVPILARALTSQTPPPGGGTVT